MNVLEDDDQDVLDSASDYYDGLEPSEKRRLVRLALNLYQRTKEYHKLLLSEEYDILTELEIAQEAMMEAQAIFRKAIGGQP